MASQKMMFGKAGEDVAVKHLKRKGYNIIEQNWRCRLGELDVIARHKDAVVFVEVKTRTDKALGFPQESVDERKQRHIIRCAKIYEQCKRLEGTNFRFDVVAIDFSSGKQEITLIQDAFQEK